MPPLAGAQTTAISPSSLLAHVLRNRRDLDLTGQVILAPSADKSDSGGYADVYEGCLYSLESGTSIRVAIKRLRLKVSDEKLAKVRRMKLW